MLKTVADIGKELIVPVGTKLLQAATGFLGGDKSAGSQAMEAIKEGGRELVQRGIQRITRRPPPEPIEMEEEEEPVYVPPPRKRKRAPKGSSGAYYKMREPIPTKKQKYEEYEGKNQAKSDTGSGYFTCGSSECCFLQGFGRCER